MTYGSVEVGSDPTQPLLAGGINAPRSRKQQTRQGQQPPLSPLRSQRPVLKTVVSKRQSVSFAPRTTTTTTNTTTNTQTTNNNDAPSPSTSRKSKSFVYSMLNPRSTTLQAVTFKWFITIVIILDLIGFILSTEPNLSPEHKKLFQRWEAIDSWIFLTEYILRFITVTESYKYGSMGPILGRLRYCLTVPALIDLLAIGPYFLELCTGWNLPTLTYVRAFRLLRILKTEGFAEAIKSVCRVFKYNSEILYVAVCIGLLMVIVVSLKKNFPTFSLLISYLT